MPRWLNLANTFTLVRLVLTPIVIVAILDKHHLLALLFLPGGGDGCAGWPRGAEAHQRTPTGAYFDPIADKCLMSGVFLVLCGGPSAVVVRGNCVGGDVYILLGALIFLAFTRIRKFPPKHVGESLHVRTDSHGGEWPARDAFSRFWPNTASEIALWLCTLLWFGAVCTTRGARY